ncbi:ribonuclease HII [Candidatus Woesearchaeota archaeon]|jgi:ribonuclease HII|nr:ribonuclease HII [Candidatus Woesearchaeota archaeon]MDP6647973.1 ribonuclease HII [Candidatus Woesearchaeota archaeon]|tara:strand:- start:11565 stop:12236 length:672 start_codon:yes stop_codon:yes gene_type:complete
MLICGIDEARRGPVIGSMVLCGALIEGKNMKQLEALKPKDSKLLTKVQREELYDKIIKVLKHYKVIIIQPEEIDRAVQGQDGLNLNKLEAKKTAEILNKFQPNKSIVDCPSINIKSYKEYLTNLLKNKKINLILEHKAERYQLVAAASIIAKVTGDREIEKLKKQIGKDFGSGYMSDPKTAKFLKDNFEKYPDIFRKSWAPYQDLVKNKFQKNLSDFNKFLKK